MLPLPRQPLDRRGPRSPAEEAGKNPALTKMAAATGQGAGLSLVGLSTPFLCFRLFVLAASFRQYLFPFLLLGAPGAREEALSARIGANTRVVGKAGLPRLTGSDVTVAAADRWKGRWVQVPAWPGPGCGTDASGERQS